MDNVRVGDVELVLLLQVDDVNASEVLVEKPAVVLRVMRVVASVVKWKYVDDASGL